MVWYGAYTDTVDVLLNTGSCVLTHLGVLIVFEEVTSEAWLDYMVYMNLGFGGGCGDVRGGGMIYDTVLLPSK